MISRYEEMQITHVQQQRGEHLNDYLDYFFSLLERYPDHGLPNSVVLDSFLHGMDPVWYDRLQDAAGHFQLVELPVEEVWELIDYVAERHRRSDHQQDPNEMPITKKMMEEMMEEMMEKMMERLDAMERKREREITELSKHVSEMADALSEIREAQRLEREQEEQNFGDKTETTTDHDSLAPEVTQEPDLLPPIVNPLPLFSLQVSRPYDREDLILLSEVETRVHNHCPILESVSIRSEPHKKWSRGTCKNVPVKLDWKRTVVKLSFKKCQRKRYVGIRKFDHIYPWDPNL